MSRDGGCRCVAFGPGRLHYTGQLNTREPALPEEDDKARGTRREGWRDASSGSTHTIYEEDVDGDPCIVYNI